MEDSWRHLSLEVVVTLAETAPAMLRRVGAKYIPLLVPQVLLLMTDLEDDPEWSVADEIIEEDNDRSVLTTHYDVKMTGIRKINYFLNC